MTRNLYGLILALAIGVSLVLLAHDSYAVVTLGSAGSETLLRAEAVDPHVFPAFGAWGSCLLWGTPSPGQTVVQLFDNTSYVHLELGRADAYTTQYPVAAASEDHLLVVYSTVPPVSGGGTAVLTAILYDAAGNQLDAEILDTNSSDRPYLNTEIAVDPNTGNFLVVWREDINSSASEVWGKLVVVVGTQLGGPSNPSLYGSAFLAGRIDVAYAERIDPPRTGTLHQRFMIVYEDNTGVLAAFVEPLLGTAVTSDVFVGAGDDPRIASRGSEGLVVYDSGGSIQARRIWPTGSFPGPAFSVSAAGQWPDVSASDSEFLVTFREPVQPGPEAIVGQYVDFSGSLVESEFDVVPPFDTLGRPAIASDGTVFLVAYTKTNGSGVPNPTDVYYSRVSPGVFTFIDTEVSDNLDATRGVAFGDWTQDFDYPDLYVANSGATVNEPFYNDEGSLVYASARGGLDSGNGQGLAHADVDNDGTLDLLLTNGIGLNALWLSAPSPFYHDLITPDPNDIDDGAHDSRSVAMADYDGDGWVDFCVANKNARNSLMHNEGGTFADDSAVLGLLVANSEGVSFADIDGDNDQDLYVGNAGSANRLYINDGSGFGPGSEQAASFGLADTGSARSVTWVDYDSDGDLDLFISKYAAANALYRNDGSSFVDVSVASGIADTGRGESACFADMDLDGDQDLFVANFNDPDRLYRNDAGVFVEVGSIIGLESNGPSLGAAWGDVDLDGDPDLVVGSYGGDNRVYINEMQSGNRWVQLELAGTVSNASAIGARVVVHNGAQTVVQWVGTGSGYLSQNDLVVTVGLGESVGKVDFVSVTVSWPSGLVEQFPSVLTETRATLIEGTATATDEDQVALHRLQLNDNVPNPFNPRTTIAFELPQASDMSLSVFDLRGRRVAVLSSGPTPVGHHEVEWDGRDGDGRQVASGVYFYRLITPARSISKPMTLLK